MLKPGCQSITAPMCVDDRYSVNNRSSPYYCTGHRKSVKIRKNSYGWQLCDLPTQREDKRRTLVSCAMHVAHELCMWPMRLQKTLAFDDLP